MPRSIRRSSRRAGTPLAVSFTLCLCGPALADGGELTASTQLAAPSSSFVEEITIVGDATRAARSTARRTT